MKFRVDSTLKAGNLSNLGGFLGPGFYDTQSLNFPPEIKEVLLAEVEDPRGLVTCIDPEDHIEVETPLKDVSFEVLDKISSGEGKAEETPPKGADTDDQHITAQAPSPVLKKNSRIKPAMIK